MFTCSVYLKKFECTSYEFGLFVPCLFSFSDGAAVGAPDRVQQQRELFGLIERDVDADRRSAPIRHVAVFRMTIRKRIRF